MNLRHNLNNSNRRQKMTLIRRLLNSSLLIAACICSRAGGGAHGGRGAKGEVTRFQNNLEAANDTILNYAVTWPINEVESLDGLNISMFRAEICQYSGEACVSNSFSIVVQNIRGLRGHIKICI